MKIIEKKFSDNGKTYNTELDPKNKPATIKWQSNPELLEWFESQLLAED